jgi:hypothetical protein
MKNLLISGGKLLLACAILTSFTNRVNAAATLTLYDGVNPLITVVDNGPGDLFGATGAILVATNVGVWNLTISSAITKPLFGTATDPVMDLGITASSTAAGSLRFVFSDNGFGPTLSGDTLIATVDGQANGSPTTVTYDVYGDQANVVGATMVHIASAGTSFLPTSATGSGPLALPAPFSLTQVETFIASGPTTFNSDASFKVIPEPGVMGLGALGLAVLALGRSQRKQA